MIVDIILWLIFGAIAGYLAGFLVKGDESLGIIGHAILGIVGAFIGGLVLSIFGFNTTRAEGDIFNIVGLIVAVFGAVIAVLVANFILSRR